MEVQLLRIDKEMRMLLDNYGLPVMEQLPGLIIGTTAGNGVGPRILSLMRIILIKKFI